MASPGFSLVSHVRKPCAQRRSPRRRGCGRRAPAGRPRTAWALRKAVLLTAPCTELYCGVRARSSLFCDQRMKHCLWTELHLILLPWRAAGRQTRGLTGKCCLVTKSCPALLQPHGLQPASLLCPWDAPSKNPGVACHFFLQGISPTQRSNSHFSNWQAVSLPPSH